MNKVQSLAVIVCVMVAIFTGLYTDSIGRLWGLAGLMIVGALWFLSVSLAIGIIAQAIDRQIIGPRSSDENPPVLY